MTGRTGDGRQAGDFADVADTAPALDLLLSDAALGIRRRFRPDGSTLRLGLGLARRPWTVGRRSIALAGELGKIAVGRSAVAPAPRDRRFADPAWMGNPFLRRILQVYLAGGAAAESLLADADLGWRDGERVGFVVHNVVDAAAPSNNPVLNPGTWKALVDTGGLSAVRGIRAFASDMATAPRIPAMVAPDAFEVGRDLAVSPGAVVPPGGICPLRHAGPGPPGA